MPTKELPGPDYELAPGMELDTPEQFKAIGDETRQMVLSMLAQKASTTSQLATAMGKPKGTIGHHVKVLETAGLVRVVRTRKVRALTEKYYGRTARTFYIHPGPEGTEAPSMLEQAIGEIAAGTAGGPPKFTLRHAQVSEERAAEFLERMVSLAEEFASSPPEGDTVFGLLTGLYPTDRPARAEDR